MFRSVTVGTLFGIPVKLDVTFLLVLPLFTWIIAVQVDGLVSVLNGTLGANIATDFVGAEPLLLGLIGALGLFGSVLLHEFGHSLVAMRYGVSIESITLWLLGGVARLSEQPQDWRRELAIAVAGPVVSVALGGLSFLVMSVLPTGADAAKFVFGYLALMNVVLAAFNMLPGFPMDGGRVLRALLGRTRSFAEATRIATDVGKSFAILLGFLGLLTLNLFWIAIAFFIYIAAAGEVQQTTLEAALEAVTVRDVMTPVEQVHTASPTMTIDDLLDQMFRERHTGYPVTEHGELRGIITIEDVRGVPPGQRDVVSVGEVMTRELETIDPDRSAIAALSAIQRNRIGRLLVTDAEENLLGLLTRTDLINALAISQERAAAPPVGRSRAGVSDADRSRERVRW